MGTGGSGTEGVAPVVGSVELDETQRTLHVVLDDGRRYELAADTDEARDLHPGLALSATLLDALERAAERKRIARRVFAWLDRRARCRADLRRRLLERSHAPDLVDEVLDRFAEQGLVDDLRFCVEWAKGRLAQKGARWIVARLRQLGVDGDVAERGARIAQEESGQDELAIAREVLRRRRLDLEQETQRQRGVRFLLGRGFDRSTCLEALRVERAENRRRDEDADGAHA